MFTRLRTAKPGSEHMLGRDMNSIRFDASQHLGNIGWQHWKSWRLNIVPRFADLLLARVAQAGKYVLHSTL